MCCLTVKQSSTHVSLTFALRRPCCGRRNWNWEIPAAAVRHITIFPRPQNHRRIKRGVITCFHFYGGRRKWQALKRFCGCAVAVIQSLLVKYHFSYVYVYLNLMIWQMCQTVCIITPVRFSADAVSSKSSFESETAFRMSSFQTYLCDRLTAVVKFLRPPYGSRTTTVRPPQLFCLQRFKIRSAAAAVHVSATEWGRRNSEADAGISQFHFLRRRSGAVANVMEALLEFDTAVMKSKITFTRANNRINYVQLWYLHFFWFLKII